MARGNDGLMLKIGVISDTHGLLRPEAEKVLRGCDRIIHGGDVGSEAILTRIRQIAPALVVRGNVDRGNWAELLPLVETVVWEGVGIHTVHDVHDLDIEPAREECRIVISGHSHRPGIEEKCGVTYLNPGSAGRRRFRLPITMALLHLAGGSRFEIEPIQLVD